MTVRNIYSFLIGIHIILYIGIVVTIATAISLIGTSFPISESISNPDELNELKKYGAVEFFVIAIILVPLLETSIFQKFVLYITSTLFRKIKHHSFFLPIIISGILFGLAHGYNMTYVVIGTLTGIVLAFFYSIALKRKESAFVVITIAHSIINLIPFFRDFIL